MRIYLVRHPRPEIANGVCYGRSDLVVSREECERAALAVSPLLPHGVTIFSSPLRRCSQLAGVLATTLQSTDVVYDPRLAEMNFGDWEMRSWNDIARAEVDAWAADLIDYCPGGGESVLQMAQRIHAFSKELKKRRDDTLVVCHAGTIRLLLACQDSDDEKEIAHAAAQNRRNIGYGELLIIDY